MEKSVATAVLLALLLFVGLRANTPQVVESAFAQISDLTPDFLKGQTDDYQMLGDSMPKPKGKQKITREDDNRRVEAEYQDGRVTRLNIDGKEIPAAEFGQHSEITDGLLRDITPPPTPPTPPAPGGWYWGDAPAPPAPPAPPTWRNAPTPPAPPTPPTPPRISTLKNSDGTTILHIENGDEAPVVIQIKDGETWVDGKKLAEGESLDLPGLSSGYNFSWSDGDAQGFHFQGLEGLQGLQGLEGLENLSQEDREEMLQAQRQALDELRYARGFARSEGHGEGHGGYAPEDAQAQKRRAEETYRDMERQHKDMEKEMKKQRKEMERTQKQSAKEMEAAMREHERAMRNHEQAMREHERAAREHEVAARESEQSTAFWGNQLRSDGLISDIKNYSFQLSAKWLKVDGKKQSEELHRKYLDLYEKRSGGKNKLSGDNSFMITTNDD